MWTVIYLSQSEESAGRLIDMLTENKVISRLRRDCADEGGKGCFEVLVPSTELETAQDLIFENELF